MRRAPFLVSLTLLAVTSSIPGLAATITTIAGGGPDNLPAVSANVRPVSVTADASGALYISDPLQNRVFKVDPSGVLTVLAGNGINGFSGDGGPARLAQLSNPIGIAVDGSGNVLISDTGNNRIRRVDAATGSITTIAGNGSGTFSGDFGPAIEAGLTQPWGLALDRSGNLLLADYASNRIRRIDAVTGIITTIAGSSFSGFDGDNGPATSARMRNPEGVAVGPSGDIYISDSGNHRVRRVSGSTGIITTIAGRGTAGYNGDGFLSIFASLSAPAGLAVDAAGNLFIADRGNSRVRRVDASSGFISTVAGTGAFDFSGDGGDATLAALSGPIDVALDTSGSPLIADFDNLRVRRITPGSGVIATIAGNGQELYAGDGVPATRARLFAPIGLSVDSQGGLLFAEAGNRRLRRVEPGTGIIRTIAGSGVLLNSIDGPGGDPADDFTEGAPALTVPLGRPEDAATDASGNIYFTDTILSRVLRVDAVTGILSVVAGAGTPGVLGDGGPAHDATLDSPRGIARDAAGNLFIADEGHERIRRIDAATGTITTVAGDGNYGFSGDGHDATQASLASPTDVAVDAAGNLFIVDHDNARVRRVDAGSGTIDTVAGNGLFGFTGDGAAPLQTSLSPYAVALSATSDLFISEPDLNRVRRLDPAGVATMAGTGLSGFSGDGGDSRFAQLRFPIGVAVSASGDLLIADNGNDRLRRVTGVLGQEPFHLFASPAVLAPPNHRLVDVTITVTGSGDCPAPSLVLLFVGSSEVDDAPGNNDGKTSPDIVGASPGTADLQFQLRAERSSHGQGRVYSARYRVDCDAIGSFDAGVNILVPHDNQGVTDPVGITLSGTPSGTLVSWTPVAGAQSYDVIRGNLESLRESGNVTNMGQMECIERDSLDASTARMEDGGTPAPGKAFFYLVDYADGSGRSGFGTEDAPLPLEKSSGGCH